jgi:hypothetical protein
MNLGVMSWVSVLDVSIDNTFQIISNVIPIVIAILTVSPTWKLVTSFRRARASTDALYQDEDGAASQESMISYSVKGSFIFVSIAIGLGLLAAFALAVFGTIHQEHFHSLSSIWILNLLWVSEISLSLKFILTDIDLHYFAGLGCVPGNPNCAEIQPWRCDRNFYVSGGNPCWNFVIARGSSIP